MTKSQVRPAHSGAVFAVLGDVVESRTHTDRRALQRRLRTALERANSLTPMMSQPLTLTVGDEFQGICKSLAAALGATLIVRLALTGQADVRFGIGRGRIRSFDPNQAPFGQDGPAWWAAREAIESTAELMTRKGAPKGLRTVYVEWIGQRDEKSQLSLFQLPLPLVGARSQTERLTNAYILCRDELVGNTDARGARLMLKRIEQEPVTRTSKREGITVSAVNQKNRKSGAYAIELSARILEAGDRSD